MWTRLLARFQKWMMAVTYAEAGEPETARQVMAGSVPHAQTERRPDRR